ncbi:MAG: hypothetical protein AAF208_09225 [Cyanobacteria bacterium P01_A01_bin.45]
MMIFILACGYLLTVYFLLGLAKRARGLTILSGFVNSLDVEEENRTDRSLSSK